MNELILSNWNISVPSEILPIKSSVGDEIHVWNIDNIYILKSGTNFESMNKHIQISKALETEGLPVALPIKTNDNNDLFYIDNYFYCLFPKLKGKNLTDCFYGDYLGRAKYLGEIVGKLHIALKKCEAFITCNDNDLYTSVINNGIPTILQYFSLDEIGLTQEFIDKYQKEFKDLYYQLPKQIIHRDLHGGNMLFDNEKLTGYIDFEISERNARIYDVCYLSTGILCGCVYDEIERENWFKLFNNIIAGYDDICHLTKEEKVSLPYMIFSIQIICIACFTQNKFEKLVSQNIDVLKWILKNIDKFHTL
jgi:Ser/Thr protein kinase RdoA (MazF antagonist)